jgi:hypothetical protein
VVDNTAFSFVFVHTVATRSGGGYVRLVGRRSGRGERMGIASRIARLAVTVGVALALAGCVHGGALPGPWPDDPIGSSRQSEGAPAEFKNREPLTTCGDVELSQGEGVPDSAFACLNDAFGSGAELAVVQPTVEGDPVVTFYRVGPNIRGMDVFTDFTLDSFGSGWSVQHCVVTVDVREPAGC